VLHRLAHRDERFQPGPDWKPKAVTILGNRLSIHELHHEERLPRLSGAAVVDAGGTGMVHERERLPLGVEPGQDRTRIHADLDQLQGHHPVHRRRLVGEVDGTHPSLAEDFEQKELSLSC
jgi:hypothetical protein